MINWKIWSGDLKLCTAYKRKILRENNKDIKNLGYEFRIKESGRGKFRLEGRRIDIDNG